MNSASHFIVIIYGASQIVWRSVCNVCVDMCMHCISVCICSFSVSVSLSLSLAQEVENWWGENCFKALKVMEECHTTSTSLGEKLLYIHCQFPRLFWYVMR